ncbi:MAG: hypothetical protein JOY80_08975, partial [Candidatus Dormibacteraeota bacterium]|nr:hypothetical protein [Candidatus Dormibacteraeota bacterium]
LRGFSNGFASKDGSAGAYFYVLQNPETPAGTSQTQAEQDWRDELVGSGGLALSVLPSDAGTPTQTSDMTDVNNLGISNEDDAVYSYSGGQLEIDTAVTSNGSVVAAFVFATDDEWNSSADLPATIFKSIVSTAS